MSSYHLLYASVLHLDHYKTQICSVPLHLVTPSPSDWQIQPAVCRLDTRTKTHKHWHTNTRHSKYNTDCKVCAGDKGEKEKKCWGGCGQPERERQSKRERERERDISEKTRRAERERDSHITSMFSWNASACGLNYTLCRLTTKTWKLSRWIYKSTLVWLAGTAELSRFGYEEHTDFDTWAAFRESDR